MATAGQPLFSGSRLPRDNLLLYRDREGRVQPVANLQDWNKRRADIVHGMEAVMGRLPGAEKRCPLDVRIEEEIDGGRYIRRLLTYASEPGSRVPAYLLVPKDVLAGNARPEPCSACMGPTTWSATGWSLDWATDRTASTPAS